MFTLIIVFISVIFAFKTCPKGKLLVGFDSNSWFSFGYQYQCLLFTKPNYTEYGKNLCENSVAVCVPDRPVYDYGMIKGEYAKEKAQGAASKLGCPEGMPNYVCVDPDLLEPKVTSKTQKQRPVQNTLLEPIKKTLNKKLMKNTLTITDYVTQTVMPTDTSTITVIPTYDPLDNYDGIDYTTTWLHMISIMKATMTEWVTKTVLETIP